MNAKARGYWVLGTESPRYCYSGQFVRGFQASSPEEALAKAKASKGGQRYHSVVEYNKNGDMRVIYPKQTEDDLPF